MNRIPLIDRAHTSPDRKALLDQIHGAFGATPNMFRAVANSPAALQSMWAAFGALGSGTLSAKLGEQIAVAVANRNACEYCLAAHTALGRKAGATADEMAAAQVGSAGDAATQAALWRLTNHLELDTRPLDEPVRASARIGEHPASRRITPDADGTPGTPSSRPARPSTWSSP